jgi:hypothetical protein
MTPQPVVILAFLAACQSSTVVGVRTGCGS